MPTTTQTQVGLADLGPIGGNMAARFLDEFCGDLSTVPVASTHTSDRPAFPRRVLR